MCVFLVVIILVVNLEYSSPTKINTGLFELFGSHETSVTTSTTAHILVRNTNPSARNTKETLVNRRNANIKAVNNAVEKGRKANITGVNVTLVNVTPVNVTSVNVTMVNGNQTNSYNLCAVNKKSGRLTCLYELYEYYDKVRQ